MVKMIDNYTLLQVIGEGNYGKVYKAKNIKSNQQYAIKIIPSQKLDQNSKLSQCTMNQVQTLTTIGQTQHIIMYYQMLKTKNNYYFVYQFCNGGTLMQLLGKQHHLQQKRTLQIFKQLLEAFKVLNKLNIMHRDLKPENIFFSDNKVKLGDFGFCKGLRPEQNLTKTMLGSPIYMAPEVLKGQSYSTKADIWSLGVILYEMLYGVCPYQSSSIAMLINTINSNQIVLPSNIKVSQKTQQLIKKLLTKDYFRRIGWIQLFSWFDEQGQQKQNVFKNTTGNRSTIDKKASLVEQWASKNKLCDINIKQRSISQDVVKKDKFKMDIGSLQNISPSNFHQKTTPFTPKLGQQNKIGQQNPTPTNKDNMFQNDQKSYSAIRQPPNITSPFQAYRKPASLPKRETPTHSNNNQTAYGHSSCYKPESSKKIFYSQNYQNIFSTPISQKNNKSNDKSIQMMVSDKQMNAEKDKQKQDSALNTVNSYNNNSSASKNRISQRISIAKNSLIGSRANNSVISTNGMNSKNTKQLKSQNSRIKRKQLLQIHEQCLIVLKQTYKLLQQKKQKYLKIAFLVINCVLQKLKEITKFITIIEIDLLDISSLINYEIIQVDRMVIDIKEQLENNMEKIPKPEDILEMFQRVQSQEENLIKHCVLKLLYENSQNAEDKSRNGLQNISILNMLPKDEKAISSSKDQRGDSSLISFDDPLGGKYSKGQYYTTNQFAEYYKNLVQSKQKTMSKISMLS